MGVNNVKKVIATLLVTGFLFTTLLPAIATNVKAKQTGKKCFECHKGNKVGPHGKKK